ncbi:MAG: ATP-binding cassette domain-containing protein [Candidatus Methanosuratus sp.]|nr:ATP-binding cassette domain-containing protein [Candidatus Methanosuratincola sp.]
MNHIIQVRELSKSFNGTTRAVDGISFEVYEGEIFGFLGPNGAGKTTTISMLTTLLRPTSGSATICGFDILKEPNEVRKRIGVVPQEYTADEDLTGYENIMFCADLYGIPRRISRERAAELLQLVELESAKDRKVETYSGGMRRRLELACGLINHPQVLFLDEPTLGLDVQTRAAVWQYIRRLKDEYGMTLFLTTHYLEEADSLCDRIAIIDHGKIVRIGSPKELKDSLGGDIIELGIQENDKEEDPTLLILGVEHVKEVKRVGPAEYRIKSELGEVTAPMIIHRLISNGYHVSKISLMRPTLDQVYLELTGKSIREENGDQTQFRRQRATLRRARS